MQPLDYAPRETRRLSKKRLVTLVLQGAIILHFLAWALGALLVEALNGLGFPIEHK